MDNSGILLTYTAQLRAHDAAFLSMGNIISQNWLQYIPPGDSQFTQNAYCSQRCLNWVRTYFNSLTLSFRLTFGKENECLVNRNTISVLHVLLYYGNSKGVMPFCTVFTKTIFFVNTYYLWDCSNRVVWLLYQGFAVNGRQEPMTVVGVQFHTQELGKQMKLRQFTHAAGDLYVERPWLANDATHDSEQQTFRVLKNRQSVGPNDHLKLECTYDSTSRFRPTVVSN